MEVLLLQDIWFSLRVERLLIIGSIVRLVLEFSPWLTVLFHWVCFSFHRITIFKEITLSEESSWSISSDKANLLIQTHLELHFLFLQANQNLFNLTLWTQMNFRSQSTYPQYLKRQQVEARSSAMALSGTVEWVKDFTKCLEKLQTHCFSNTTKLELQVETHISSDTKFSTSLVGLLTQTFSLHIQV